MSFRAVVAPLLASSCAFSGCHKRNSGIALDFEIESAELHALLLTGIPVAAPTMRYVVPGQWPKSFLLSKLDGTQCSLGEACEVDACGERMPLGSEPLAASERDDLRRWIAQGAALD